MCKYIVNCLSESRIFADGIDFADFGESCYQIYEKPGDFPRCIFRVNEHANFRVFRVKSEKGRVSERGVNTDNDWVLKGFDRRFLKYLL